MDYRDAAAYWWQGLHALAVPVFLAGMFMMAADPSRFPWLAFVGIGLAVAGIVPWAICMNDDRPVRERKGGWL
jgi:hypothetical protein